jgi:hypothetical protein
MQAVKGLCYNSLNRYAPSPRSTASLAGISGGVFVYFSVKMTRCGFLPGGALLIC